MNKTIVTLHNGTEVHIRPLAAGDGPALQQFNEGISPSTRRLFLPHAYDDATVAKIIARAMRGTDLVWVAVAGSRIVGYGFLWDIHDPVPVLGIGLADACQGQGLGAHFLGLIIDAARDAGRDGIELTTVPENVRAFALYRKMGFRHIGDTDNVAGDGRMVREHVMFLPLVPGAVPPARDFGPPA